MARSLRPGTEIRGAEWLVRDLVRIGARPPWPRGLPSIAAQFIVATDEQETRAVEGWIDQRVELGIPNVAERERLWRLHVPEAAEWDASAVSILAQRHRLSVGEIVAIGTRAPATVDEAAELGRDVSRHRLGELGKLVVCPFGWDDLVVPSRLRADLEDFAYEAKTRAKFWEQPQARRLFPRGTSLVGLMTGPPGTGKTMAAQVLAADLGLDLVRIDLATVVSKYIGETSRNLRKIFLRAARMNAVLLFDEADALFAKRTEVKDSHDRHANADTNYLLQLLEEYDGVAILASNKKANMDPAFLRRMRYILDFPKPDAVQRGTIWRRVVGELAGGERVETLATLLETVARGVDLSGAQIKNAALAALFVADKRREPLSSEHLMKGIDRELGKEGRHVNPKERERIRRYA